MPETIFNRKEAIEYLGIEDKEFDNYFKNSKEIKPDMQYKKVAKSGTGKHVYLTGDYKEGEDVGIIRTKKK